MNSKSNEQSEQHSKYNYKSVVIGAGAGIVFGAAFGNPGIGLVLGACAGLILNFAKN